MASQDNHDLPEQRPVGGTTLGVHKDAEKPCQDFTPVGPIPNPALRALLRRQVRVRLNRDRLNEEMYQLDSDEG